LFDLWQASLPEFFFSKPIRRLEPIERPAEEAKMNRKYPNSLCHSLSRDILMRNKVVLAYEWTQNPLAYL
jgi:hypothetical protein